MTRLEHLALLAIAVTSCARDDHASWTGMVGRADEQFAKLAKLGCAADVRTHPGLFSCTKQLDPGTCRVLVGGNVITHSDGTSYVGALSVDLVGCEPTAGTEFVLQVFDPLVSWAHRDALHELLFQPRLERPRDRVNDLSIVQYTSLEGKGFAAEFGAGEQRPSRCYRVDMGQADFASLVHDTPGYTTMCGSLEEP